jgi:hypothetical protein
MPAPIRVFFKCYSMNMTFLHRYLACMLFAFCLLETEAFRPLKLSPGASPDLAFMPPSRVLGTTPVLQVPFAKQYQMAFFLFDCYAIGIDLALSMQMPPHNMSDQDHAHPNAECGSCDASGEIVRSDSNAICLNG